MRVSQLVSDFPEISEMDLNPVFASKDGAIAADVRIVVNFEQKAPRYRPAEKDVVTSMNRIMQPKSVAVIGASSEAGKIGNSVMKNLINGGYKGKIYPIHPKDAEILGYKAYKSVKDVPEEIDTAVFAIPAKFVAGALKECGEKKIAGAILIPSGFGETGNIEGQEELQTHRARVQHPPDGAQHLRLLLHAVEPVRHLLHGLRLQGLHRPVVAVGRHRHGHHRLLAQAKMGVSAIVGLGNKSDIDEDDLLLFFEQDDNTKVIAQHCEDLKDGRAFAEVAKRVSKKKPVIMLKAGRTSAGAAAASSHTGALAGNDKIYDDVLRQSGVIRAKSLRQTARLCTRRADPADAQGRERGDHHRRRRLGRAAVRCLRRQRPEAAQAHARGPGRGLPQVHPAVRRGRQPGGHHRRRAAHHLHEHGAAGPGGRPHPRADPGLLAHDRDAADGVRAATWCRSSTR